MSESPRHALCIRYHVEANAATQTSHVGSSGSTGVQSNMTPSILCTEQAFGQYAGCVTAQRAAQTKDRHRTTVTLTRRHGDSGLSREHGPMTMVSAGRTKQRVLSINRKRVRESYSPGAAAISQAPR